MHTTSYYQAPDDALESPPAMAEWIRLGVAAAIRSGAKLRPRKDPAGTRSRKKA